MIPCFYHGSTIHFTYTNTVLFFDIFASDICSGPRRFLDDTRANDPLSVPGFGDTTCSKVYSAGNVNYSIPAESCPEIKKAIGDSCCTGDYAYGIWYVLLEHNSSLFQAATIISFPYERCCISNAAMSAVIPPSFPTSTMILQWMQQDLGRLHVGKLSLPPIKSTI
jgi:hypothetical protein